MLQVAYRFDKDGYFFGTCSVQEDSAGNVLLPSDCTMLEPSVKKGYFARFVNGKWTNEKIPTTCAEAIAANYSCISNGPEKHNQEVKAVMEALVEAEKDTYRTKVDDNFVMTIEEIPEPTQKEKDEAALAELNAQLETIKRNMVTAQAVGDDEWYAELQAEYRALISYTGE